MDVDGIGEIVRVVLRVHLCHGVSSNRLKRLVHARVLLGTGLKVGNVASGLAEGLGPLGRHGPLALLHIHLVTNHHKGKVLGIPGVGEQQKLVSPESQGVETLGVVDVVDQHTAVCASVESQTEGLEPFLAGGVPDLHVDLSALESQFLVEEVCADGGLVLCRELVVDVLLPELVRTMRNSERLSEDSREQQLNVIDTAVADRGHSNVRHSCTRHKP